MTRNTLTKLLSLGLIILISSSSYALEKDNILSSTIPTIPQDETKRANSSDDHDQGILSPGVIRGDQTICNSEFPESVVNIESPTAEPGVTITVKWEKKSNSSSSWELIPGENGLNYTPLAHLTETTQYRRACRTSSINPWRYSNIVTKNVFEGISNVKVTSSDVVCKGENSGSAFAEVTGGTPAYTFSWSNSEITQEVSDLSAGIYSVIVTDANGCKFITENFEITEPQERITLSETFRSEPTCNGSDDGVLLVAAQSGTPPYRYDWSNGKSESINLNITGGTYSVKVEDINGCISELKDIILPEPEPFKLEKSGRTVTCFGKEDANVKLQADGGTGPYYYKWPDGVEAKTRSSLDAGDYKIIVVDQNECFLETIISIEEPTPLTTESYTTSNQICKATTNIISEGGTAPYSYEWKDGYSDSFRGNLCPGDYEISVTDNNGCKTTKSITIKEEYIPKEIKIEFLSNGTSNSNNLVLDLPSTSIPVINIYNASGQIIKTIREQKPDDNNQLFLNLDLSMMSSGIYFVYVASDGIESTKKMMVSKY